MGASERTWAEARPFTTSCMLMASLQLGVGCLGDCFLYRTEILLRVFGLLPMTASSTEGTDREMKTVGWR